MESAGFPPFFCFPPICRARAGGKRGGRDNNNIRKAKGPPPLVVVVPPDVVVVATVLYYCAKKLARDSLSLSLSCVSCGHVALFLLALCALGLPHHFLLLVGWPERFYRSPSPRATLRRLSATLRQLAILTQVVTYSISGIYGCILPTLHLPVLSHGSQQASFLLTCSSPSQPSSGSQPFVAEHVAFL